MTMNMMFSAKSQEERRYCCRCNFELRDRYARECVCGCTALYARGSADHVAAVRAWCADRDLCHYKHEPPPLPRDLRDRRETRLRALVDGPVRRGTKGFYKLQVQYEG